MLLLSFVVAAGLCAVFCRSDHSPDDVLTFLLLGDWGKGGTSGTYGQRRALGNAPASLSLSSNIELQGMELQKEKKVLRQMQVANAMGAFAAQANPKPSFLIALGDNFYDNGVYSSTDVLWKYLWQDVYLGFDALNIPWFPILGNHDYGYGATGVKAQIQRTYEHTDDDIWEFPSTNYTRRFDIPGKGGGSVVIVFIDTTTLAPSINRCCNSNGGVSETVQKQRVANQLMHIERMLNDTLSDPPNWLLVAGHYPIYSASSNGDVAELQTYLLPLLAKYKVHAYICGHDHIGEHLQKSGYETEFFVVGAGTMVDTANAASSAGQLVWAGPSYASFASINATLVDLTIAFRDTNGTLRYNYTLTNPNPNFVPPDSGKGGTDGNSSNPGTGTESGGGYGRRESMLSWSYWVDTASNASEFDVAVASGGVAALGMMLFVCFLFFKRRSSQVKEKATQQFLLQARTREMIHSPSRGGTKKLSAFYGRKKYSELMEMGDLEEGGEHEHERGHEGEGRHRQDTDYFSDEDDDYINMAPAAAVAAAGAKHGTPSTSTETLNSNEEIPSRSRAATSAHSRSSSTGSFASSTNHGRYSHSLSEEQNAAASAWLETHPRKASWAGVSPPPPSPGGEKHSLQERVLSTGPLYNPLHMSQKLSPPKGGASSPSPSPSTPSPPKGSPPSQTDALPRAPKKTHHTSTSGRLSADEGIGMDPMSSLSASPFSQPAESPADPLVLSGGAGRVRLPPRSGSTEPHHNHHRRLHTSPV